MGFWQRSSLSAEDNTTPCAGETPEELGYNYAKSVDTEGLSEADLLAGIIEESEDWSDNALEQGEYLMGMRQGFGLSSL